MSKLDDWQNVCKDNKSRAEHILQKEKLTDCKFVVGQDPDKAVTIRGHKLILAMASPVFERMFYGNFDEKSNEIRIPDITESTFRLMMDYIYFEKLELQSDNDAVELYSAAKKYMLQSLLRECINYLNEHYNASNVCKIYEFAVFFEEKSLVASASDFMACNTAMVLAEPSFLDANLNTIIMLFEKDYLRVDSELDLFNALHRYALEHGYFDRRNSDSMSQLSEPVAESIKVECKAVESEKALLKEAVKKIRFLSLTSKQFEFPAKSKLLTDSEALSIVLNILNPNIEDCPMPEGFSTIRYSRS